MLPSLNKYATFETEEEEREAKQADDQLVLMHVGEDLKLAL